MSAGATEICEEMLGRSYSTRVLIEMAIDICPELDAAGKQIRLDCLLDALLAKHREDSAKLEELYESLEEGVTS